MLVPAIAVFGAFMIVGELVILRVNAQNRLKGLVTGSLSKDVFADADLVIEAVFEEMSVKQQVFAEVEAVVSPECVLATNTSSLPVTALASGEASRT